MRNPQKTRVACLMENWVIILIKCFYTNNSHIDDFLILVFAWILSSDECKQEVSVNRYCRYLETIKSESEGFPLCDESSRIRYHIYPWKLLNFRIVLSKILYSWVSIIVKGFNTQCSLIDLIKIQSSFILFIRGL